MFLITACSNPLGNRSIQSIDYHPGFTVSTSSPKILSLSPTSGTTLGGTLLTLEGSEFVKGATISIGGSLCLNVTFISATKMTCVTPGHVPGAVSVVVKNIDLGTFTSTSTFNYLSTSNPLAGFATAAGGGIASGAGVRVKFTVGIVANPAIQQGATVSVRTGLPGTLPHP